MHHIQVGFFLFIGRNLNSKYLNNVWIVIRCHFCTKCLFLSSVGKRWKRKRLLLNSSMFIGTLPASELMSSYSSESTLPLKQLRMMKLNFVSWQSIKNLYIYWLYGYFSFLHTHSIWLGKPNLHYVLLISNCRKCKLPLCSPPAELTWVHIIWSTVRAVPSLLLLMMPLFLPCT